MAAISATVNYSFTNSSCLCCSKTNWSACSLYQCWGWWLGHWNARALHLSKCMCATPDTDNYVLLQYSALCL